MGALLFMGMIGSIAYGTYCVKKDIEATVIDNKAKPTLNKTTNKSTINQNFKNICKRSGIKISPQGNPLDLKQCHKGMEYLQYQGFDEQSVNYFKDLYVEKFELQQTTKEKEIKEKHRKLLNIARNNMKNTLLIFRREYYGTDNPKQRMDKLMKNELWKELVNNYTYIRGNGSASFCEVWTLYVPKDFFKDNIFDDEKNQLYKEICWIEKMDDGSYM